MLSITPAHVHGTGAAARKLLDDFTLSSFLRMLLLSRTRSSSITTTRVAAILTYDLALRMLYILILLACFIVCLFVLGLQGFHPASQAVPHVCGQGHCVRLERILRGVPARRAK